MSMRTCSYFNCLRGAVLLLLFYAVSATYVLINKTEQDSTSDFSLYLSTEASKALSQTHPTTDTSTNAFDPPAAGAPVAGAGTGTASSTSNTHIVTTSIGASSTHDQLVTNSSNHLAQGIVRKAYRETFANLVHSCTNVEHINNCLENIYRHEGDDEEGRDKGTDATTKLPSMSHQGMLNTQHWWFRSMLRDAAYLDKKSQNSGLQGPWHIAQSSNPNVSMCTIEKIGTSQWRKVFSALNTEENANSTGLQLRSNRTHVIDLPSADYPSFVILRDPLERFLSAYLDKCVNGHHRQYEKHCEPNDIFNSEHQGTNNDGSLLSGFSFQDNQKTMFAAYVDTMPLKWNLHFFPQSLYCNGIYRVLKDYDFIGYMEEGSKNKSATYSI